MNNPYRAGYPEKKAVVVPNYGAGVVTDPLMLPVTICGAIYYNQTGVLVSTTIPPDHNSAVVSGTTKVNLCTVNGSGFLYNIITPTGDAGTTSIATVIITINGIPYTIATTA